MNVGDGTADAGFGFVGTVHAQRIEPHLSAPGERAKSPLVRLKERLVALVGCDYTVQRLIDLAKDQLENVWDELSHDDVTQLGSWLAVQLGATKGEARIKWALVHDTFASMRETKGAI
jgi:hypothetical protein